MNNYIYEMDVARLRISYVLPKNLFCIYIRTELENDAPYDGSNMKMTYECAIRDEYPRGKNGEILGCNIFKSFDANSLQELVEIVRRWVIKERDNTHSIVEKSPEDGTDSVIKAQ